ncbi:DUF2934 domain-containing protein [Bradyrhizobium sp. UFLA05-153]
MTKGEAVHSREVRMSAYEDDIRRRAYKLWEEAGRPEVAYGRVLA